MLRDDSWWDWYRGYLAGPVWREKRRRVLLRDGYFCQACHERTATQVHHLSYRYVGMEPDFDLVAVCEPCHAALTDADRGKGLAGYVDTIAASSAELPAKPEPGDNGAPPAFDESDELAFERVREVRHNDATINAWLPAIEAIL